MSAFHLFQTFQRASAFDPKRTFATAQLAPRCSREIHCRPDPATSAKGARREQLRHAEEPLKRTRQNKPARKWDLRPQARCAYAANGGELLRPRVLNATVAVASSTSARAQPSAKARL